MFQNERLQQRECQTYFVFEETLGECEPVMFTRSWWNQSLEICLLVPFSVSLSCTSVTSQETEHGVTPFSSSCGCCGTEHGVMISFPELKWVFIPSTSLFLFCRKESLIGRMVCVTVCVICTVSTLLDREGCRWPLSHAVLRCQGGKKSVSPLGNFIIFIQGRHSTQGFSMEP